MANAIAIVANVVKIQENTVCIMAGRFFFGVCGGLMNFCFSKALNETVPQENSQAYGMLVNAGMCFGIFASNLLGMMVPLEEGPEAMEQDQSWRLVFGAPIACEILALVLIPLFVEALSLKNALQTSEDQEFI